MRHVDGMIGQLTLREIQDKLTKKTGSEMKESMDKR
jgi:hypothetical protein